MMDMIYANHHILRDGIVPLSKKKKDSHPARNRNHHIEKTARSKNHDLRKSKPVEAVATDAAALVRDEIPCHRLVRTSKIFSAASDLILCKNLFRSNT